MAAERKDLLFQGRCLLPLARGDSERATLPVRLCFSSLEPAKKNLQGFSNLAPSRDQRGTGCRANKAKHLVCFFKIEQTETSEQLVTKSVLIFLSLSLRSVNVHVCKLRFWQQSSSQREQFGSHQLIHICLFCSSLVIALSDPCHDKQGSKFKVPFLFYSCLFVTECVPSVFCICFVSFCIF